MKLELGNNKQTNLIIQYLLDLAQKDSQLKLAIEKVDDKDFESGCYKYIYENARKQAQNGVAMIEDKDVFNWAFEYFIDYEQIKAKEKENKAKTEVKKVDAETSKTETKKTTKKASKKTETIKQVEEVKPIEKEVITLSFTESVEVIKKQADKLIKESELNPRFKALIDFTKLIDIKGRIISHTIKEENINDYMQILNKYNTLLTMVNKKNNKSENSETIQVVETKQETKKEETKNIGYKKISLFDF